MPPYRTCLYQKTPISNMQYLVTNSCIGIHVKSVMDHTLKYWMKLVIILFGNCVSIQLFWIILCSFLFYKYFIVLFRLKQLLVIKPPQNNIVKWHKKVFFSIDYNIRIWFIRLKKDVCFVSYLCFIELRIWMGCYIYKKYCWNRVICSV